ncbi:hypothetical protein Fmac_023480 [Flemingia macrophylla]|uniref:Cupin type-1 domain-containing protein n=1 Tax=Flemingia macrophylla TaxID=520843 RepID=A0ABD1LLN6_9FABA
MRARFPVLLLGVVFLASVSVSFGIAYWERDNPIYSKCLRSCNAENDVYRHQACHARCNLLKEEKEDDPSHEEEGAHRQRGHQEGEKEEKKHHHEEDPQPHEKEEHPRPFPRPHRPHHAHHQSESQTHDNPFHFNSNNFFTFFKNQYGHIRALQSFGQRSTQLQNLRDYRVLEFKSKPNTLVLPNHVDAEILLVVVSGKAILNIVSPDGRDSFALKQGDAQRIPAGTTYYLVNPDDQESLRVASLAIPVNQHAKFESFFLSSTESQQSYMQGFSKSVLEASFDTEFEEINKVLFGEEEQQEGVIVELSKEQIRELSKHAKSSSRKTISSEDKPFNLRNRDPIYSNEFGKLFEITPEKNPQLRELDIFLSFVEMNEGALFLPHFNSKATVILVISEGEADIELVGMREQENPEQQDEPLKVQRFKAELSEGDVFVIPAAYPVVLNATSNFNFFAFGLNAENNQRNFLAGEKDNVISQIHRQVKELAFPGSAQDVEKLLKNQKESYFVNAQSEPKEERKQRKGPLSSILRAFY